MITYENIGSVIPVTYGYYPSLYLLMLWFVQQFFGMMLQVMDAQVKSPKRKTDEHVTITATCCEEKDVFGCSTSLVLNI